MLCVTTLQIELLMLAEVNVVIGPSFEEVQSDKHRMPSNFVAVSSIKNK